MDEQDVQYDQDNIFAGPWPEGENERQVSGQVIPKFTHYVLDVLQGTAGYAYQDMERPQIRVRIRVAEGPEGTEGMTGFIALPLWVSKREPTGEKDADSKKVFVPKTKEKWAEDRLKFAKRLNRVARIGRFEKERPLQPDGDEYAAYAAQFHDFQMIGDVRVDRSGEKKGYSPENTLWWDSVAALDDPADDKKNKELGMTALEEARLKIAAANKAEQARAAKAKS